MPTYDYDCSACGHRFEAFHGMSTTLTACPSCGRESVRRRIGGGAGLIFKGSGFYQTDYKGGVGKAAAPKSDPATPKTDTAPPSPAAASPKPSSGD